MVRTEIDLAEQAGPMRVDTNEARTLWVLGHRVTMLPVGGRVAAIEVVTPARRARSSPAPPRGCRRILLRDRRTLGRHVWRDLDDARAGRLHQRSPRRRALVPQRGPDDVRVITAFEPQGFERFFLEYGVDVDEPGAFETSVSETTIARVVKGCSRFGMILAPA